MQATLVNVRQPELLDHRLVVYLARLAGRHPEKFCVPTISQLRFAAWTNDDDLISERIDHLVEAGRIIPASRRIKGKIQDGFVVLPEKLWRATNRFSPQLTASDRAWLREIRVGWDSPAQTDTAGSGRGTRGTEPRAIAAADGGGL